MAENDCVPTCSVREDDPIDVAHSRLTTAIFGKPMGLRTQEKPMAEEEIFAETARLIGQLPDTDEAEQELIALLKSTSKAPKQREIILKVLKITGQLSAAEAYTHLEEEAKSQSEQIIQKAHDRAMADTQEVRYQTQAEAAEVQRNRSALEREKAEFERYKEAERQKMTDEQAPMLALIEAILAAAGFGKDYRGQRVTAPPTVALGAIQAAANMYGKHPMPDVNIGSGQKP